MSNDLQQNYVTIPDQYFPVSIVLHNKPVSGSIFADHWHEHLQFIYCVTGAAKIYCNRHPIHLAAEEIMFINANEIHYGESLNGGISYYIIMVDPSFILSNEVDSCQTKYISPLMLNQILFTNKINNDEELTNCIKKIINEYNTQQTGYELAVKACIYNAIVLLLRNHVVRSFSPKEYDLQVANMQRFQKVFNYIEKNYTQRIYLKDLADIAFLSTNHFCRVFKKLTGKSAIDYINQLRIEKAVTLLKQGQNSIKEIAFITGFDDTNYFSRIFKKYKQIAPNQFQKT